MLGSSERFTVGIQQEASVSLQDDEQAYIYLNDPENFDPELSLTKDSSNGLVVQKISHHQQLADSSLTEEIYSILGSEAVEVDSHSMVLRPQQRIGRFVVHASSLLLLPSMLGNRCYSTWKPSFNYFGKVEALSSSRPNQPVVGRISMPYKRYFGHDSITIIKSE